MVSFPGLVKLIDEPLSVYCFVRFRKQLTWDEKKMEGHIWTAWISLIITTLFVEKTYYFLFRVFTQVAQSFVLLLFTSTSGIRIPTGQKKLTTSRQAM